MDTQVIIVGGGIAGLTTALALGLAGIECVVLERSKFEDDTGAGIQLTPNATRVLFALGLRNPLTAVAHRPNIVATRHWRTGAVLSTVSLRTVVKQFCDSPYLQLLRSALVNVLQRACAEQPNIQLIANVDVQKLDQKSDQVYLHTSTRRFSAPMVVGADGIHSTVSKLIGNQREPQFAGWQAWRAVLQNPDFHVPSLSNTNVWCGRSGHIVHYPVSGDRSYNCIFVTKTSESLSGKWKQNGSVNELRTYYHGWHREVNALIDQLKQDALFRWGLYRHARLNNSWNLGRVVLVGDAAHATMPFLAQGAALAIEDAIALAHRLSTFRSDVAAAIHSFVEYRKPRARNIQSKSEQMGKLYHLHFPWSKFRDWSTHVGVNRLAKSVYAFESN